MFFVFLTLIQWINSMRVGPGTLTSTESFEFVTKFVYNYNPDIHVTVGSIAGHVTAATASYLVVYDDEPYSWATMQQTNLSLCNAIAHAPNGPAKRTWYLAPGKKTPINLLITEHLRPRIWYFAIVAQEWEQDSHGMFKPTKCQNKNEKSNAKEKTSDLMLDKYIDTRRRRLLTTPPTATVPVISTTTTLSPTTLVSAADREISTYPSLMGKLQNLEAAVAAEKQKSTLTLAKEKNEEIAFKNKIKSKYSTTVHDPALKDWLNTKVVDAAVELERETQAGPTQKQKNADRFKILDAVVEIERKHQIIPNLPKHPDASIDLKDVNFVAGTEVLKSHDTNKLALGLIEVDLTFLNVEQGWQRQFGFDEYGILPGTVLLIVVYALLFAYQMYTENATMKHVAEASQASAIRRQHTGQIKTPGGTTSSYNQSNSSGAGPLVRIWAILVLIQIGALLLRTVDLYSYATTGDTATRWRWGRAMTVSICSHTLDLLCRLGLTMAVFLVARGWTITSGPGEVRGKRNVLLLFGMTAVVEIGGHAFISLTYDPMTTSYGYQSTAGSVVVGWRCIELVWFVINIIQTYCQETDYKRRKLYIIFGITFSVWFVSLPGVVLSVNRLISEHWRYKIVKFTIDIIHFVSLTAYGVIFWPSWSSQYFEIRGSPRSIDEQNQLLGIVETTPGGSSGWSFDRSNNKRSRSVFYNTGDDGL